MPVSYVLPIKSVTPRADLTEYLRWLGTRADLVVVDGSGADVFAVHAAEWAGTGRHIPVDPDLVTPMGKVGGVMTGVRHARNEAVVIADDDVRYELDQLDRIERALASADVVRPQNCFDPVPWHARWDTGRVLLNRALGGDWPGTMGVRRSVLLDAGGYAGDVLFENLELVRTIEAAGGRAIVDLGVIVRRAPPSTRQFFEQRVRQAYDEMARPPRLAFFLALAPLVVRTRGRAAVPLALGSVAVAELGRRRAGGRDVFPASAALWAPLWLAERAITSWLAAASQIAFGGVRYRGTVLRRAATPPRELRRRVTKVAQR